MKNTRSKRLLAYFLVTLCLSTQNTSARIAGWQEIRDNIAFSKKKKCVKTDEFINSKKLIEEINDFVEKIEDYKSFGSEYILFNLKRICQNLYEYLCDIKRNRSENKTYSTLYRKIVEQRYENDDNNDKKTVITDNEEKKDSSIKNEDRVDIKLDDDFENGFEDYPNKLNSDNDEKNVDVSYDYEYEDKISKIKSKNKIIDKNGKEITKPTNDPSYFYAYLDVEDENKSADKKEKRVELNKEINLSNESGTAIVYNDNKGETDKLIYHDFNIVDNSKNIEEYFKSKLDIIAAFPGEKILENKIYSNEYKINKLLEWLGRVSKDIYGGWYTVWDEDIKKSLKDLSSLNIYFNKSSVNSNQEAKNNNKNIVVKIQ